MKAVFYNPFNNYSNNFVYDFLNIQKVDSIQELIDSADAIKCYYLWELDIKRDPDLIRQIPEHLKVEGIKIFLDISTGEIPTSSYKHLAELIKEYGSNHFVIHLNTQHEFDEFNKLFTEPKPLIFFSNRNEILFFENLLTSFRPKRFLFLSRRFTPNRLLIFLDLHKRKILKNCHYTFSIFKNVYGATANYEKLTRENLIEIWENNFSSHESDYVKELNDYFFDNISNLYDELDNFVGTGFGNQNPYQIANLFNESYMSLLVESKIDYDSNLYQPSEKLMKCFYYNHPFLVYSTQNFLAHTKKSGYRTFDMLDESYDDIPNYIDRIKAINDQAQYLNNLGIKKFLTLYNVALPILNHNHNRLTSKMYDPYSHFRYNDTTTDFAKLFQGNMIFRDLNL